MLINDQSTLYIYSIPRDFGFAPNPFHGVCTLATCKPGIRSTAKIGDWVIGVGGTNLKLQNKKCIFIMRVTRKIDFQDYWDDPEFNLKKPIRNGSNVQMLGDNIYHKAKNGIWIQEDSHHSNADGSQNQENLKRDTQRTKNVLISNHFIYFGKAAISVNLKSIEFHRIRNYKKVHLTNSKAGRDLVTDIISKYSSSLNLIVDDPCHFDSFYKRVNQDTGKIT